LARGRSTKLDGKLSGIEFRLGRESAREFALMLTDEPGTPHNPLLQLEYFVACHRRCRARAVGCPFNCFALHQQPQRPLASWPGEPGRHTRRCS
jgi:hypothetical protein